MGQPTAEVENVMYGRNHVLSKKTIPLFIMKGYGLISAIDVFKGRCTEVEVFGRHTQMAE